MSSEADILAAAILGKAAHDLRNKASALVGAADLLQASGLADQPSGEHVRSACEILGDGEREMGDLADAWSAASQSLYSPCLVTIGAQTLLSNLKNRLATPTRLDADPAIVVRVDERVLDVVLARVSARVEIGEIVVRREDGFGLAWLVVEAIGLETGEIGRTVAETALLKMLDAHPLKKAPAWVFGFRLRLD